MASLLGSKPNQVSTNGDLGTLAFQDSNAVNITGGTVDVSAGTAALPTLGTTGDPNTGVFFPAADTVAVATNGVERVRVSDTGNVGIGTASPSQALDITRTGASAYLSTTNGTVQAVYGTSNGASAGLLGTFSNHPQVFWTNNTERMRIDSSGNVGIGTSSPSTKLHVLGTGNNVVLSETTGTTALAQLKVVGTGAKQSYLWQASASFPTYQSLIANNAGIYATTNLSYEVDGAFYHSWWTNASERMRIHASGGVSIGNTTDRGAASLNVSGLIYPQQASTAPTYVKGAIYFDTTLNKLRVGGATAWETITSV